MKVCWNITNICNEDCYYCFRELVENEKSLEENMQILEKLKACGVTVITFAGGEPLLYKKLPDLLIYAQKLGIENRLITNGSILESDNLSHYLKYISKLTFSIDSPSEYVNITSGRGIDHYRHIKELLPIIKEKFPHLPIEINTVAASLNLHEVDFMFEAIGTTLRFYGIKKWKISRFCPLRGWAKQRESILSITDKDFSAIKERYDGVSALFDISVRNFDSLDENIIVSPAGKLTKSHQAKEYILIDNVLETPTSEINKTLSIGGYHV